VLVAALDDELVIRGDDGHHLTRARRLRVGEAITAGDGRGGWRPYLVADAGRGSLTLRADGEPRCEPELTPRLGVAFALTKGNKPETVVARLTELGVDVLQPVVAHRSVVRWDVTRIDDALARLNRVAHEAAMQSRRSRLPVVERPVDVEALAGRPGLVVADREGIAPSDLSVPGPEGWLVVVGPEGGLDEEELGALGAAPHLAVGPHVLRSETAAVAAAAALAGRRRVLEGHGGWAKTPKS
jgi:16S rRNA (uracil1498-N3)-methyltransferase